MMTKNFLVRRELAFAGGTPSGGYAPEEGKWQEEAGPPAIFMLPQYNTF
jgi:hypothetical protein